MTDRHDRVADDEAARVRAAHEAQDAAQRAADALHTAEAAQRSAADRLDGSADSHVKAARTYDDSAEQRPEHAEKFRLHATRHRRLAHDAREATQQTGENADERTQRNGI